MEQPGAVSEKSQSDGANDEEKPARARRQSASPRKAGEKSQRPFYPDEHPEIPTIRRASLKQTRIEVLTASDQDAEDEEVSPRRSRNESVSRPTRKNKQTEMLPFTGLEDDTARHEKVSKQRLRDTSLHPVTPRSARRVRRSISAPFWQRRKGWLLAGLLALLLLILIPFTVGILRNNAGQHSTQSVST